MQIAKLSFFAPGLTSIGASADSCLPGDYLPKDFFPQLECAVEQDVRLVMESNHLDNASAELKNNAYTYEPGAVFAEGQYWDTGPKSFGLEDQKIHQGALLLNGISSLNAIFLKKMANLTSQAEDFFLQQQYVQWAFVTGLKGFPEVWNKISRPFEDQLVEQTALRLDELIRSKVDLELEAFRRIFDPKTLPAFVLIAQATQPMVVAAIKSNPKYPFLQTPSFPLGSIVGSFRSALFAKKIIQKYCSVAALGPINVHLGAGHGIEVSCLLKRAMPQARLVKIQTSDYDTILNTWTESFTKSQAFKRFSEILRKQKSDLNDVDVVFDFPKGKLTNNISFPRVNLSDADIHAVEEALATEGIHLSWVPKAGDLSYFSVHRDPFFAKGP